MSQAASPRRRDPKRRRPPHKHLAKPNGKLAVPARSTDIDPNLERLAVVMLFLTAMLIFSRGARSLGFYYDDSGFLITLPSIRSFSGLWWEIRHYVPGRNLHILWQYLFFWPFKHPADHLTALHNIQSIVDAATVILFYFVLRRLKLSAAASFTASALFAFWPIHGETHFWMSSLPMNIVSTAFLLIFILTSLSVLEGSTARWIYALDAISCWCAMLTYDQTFGPLLLIIGARVAYVLVRKSPAWRPLIGIHVLEASAAIFFLWLRSTGSAASSPMPFEGADLWRRFFGNVTFSIELNLWRLGSEHVRMITQKANDSDRNMAMGVVIAIFLFAVWLTKERATRNGPALGWLSGLAACFWVAAYFPVWMWYPAARHHYLPTVGLFCVVAVFLHWLQSIFPYRFLTAIAHLGLAAVLVTSVVATLSESRHWEEAFLSKRQLVEGLRSKLAGKSGLVLEGFPELNGPARVITPHDTVFAIRLLLPDLSLPTTFHGTLRAKREGETIVFDPELTVPNSAPKVSPANETLWLHFEGMENGVLHYSEKDLSSAFPEAR